MKKYPAVRCGQCGRTWPAAYPVHCPGCCVLNADGSADHITAPNFAQVVRDGSKCVSRGELIRRERCHACGAQKYVEIFACEKHKECTPHKANGRIRSCLTCGDYRQLEMPRPTILNCLYHVCALEQNDIWLRNVNQLIKNDCIFTGRKIAAIAVGDGILPARRVKAAFGPGWDFFTVENDPQLREVVSFLPLLKFVASIDPEEATFYAHTKGNSTAKDVLGATYWRNAAYHYLLDEWEMCIDLLRTNKAVGIHQITWSKTHQPPYPSGLKHGNWMFAGTFFWFRHDAVFTKPEWSYVPVDRYGAEAWLSGLLAPNECQTVFQLWDKNVYPSANPYDPSIYPQPFPDPWAVA